MIRCIFCADVGWVCENHRRRPWEGRYACDCGGAGMPCQYCNTPAHDKASVPPGKIEPDKSAGVIEVDFSNPHHKR